MLLDQLMFNTISATKAALKATWFCPGWSDVWLGRWKRNSSIGNSWKKQLQKRRIFFIWIILFICKIIPDKFKKGRKTLQNDVLGGGGWEKFSSHSVPEREEIQWESQQQNNNFCLHRTFPHTQCVTLNASCKHSLHCPAFLYTKGIVIPDITHHLLFCLFSMGCLEQRLLAHQLFGFLGKYVTWMTVLELKQEQGHQDVWGDTTCRGKNRNERMPKGPYGFSRIFCGGFGFPVKPRKLP